MARPKVTPKREIILLALQESPKTAEELIEIADTNKGGLTSQFSYLRLMGFYPIKKADSDVYELVSEAEWNKILDDKYDKAQAKKSPAQTPEKRFEVAKARAIRCERGKVLYETKNAELVEADETPSREIELRTAKSLIELELAEMEYASALAGMPEGFDPDAEVEVVENDNSEDTDTPEDLA